MSDDKKLLTFPCEFPIKALGGSGDELEAAVLTIINKHVKNLPEGAFKLTPSKEGKYTSITITITATSQEQLDAIYSELTACKHVLMAL